MADKLYRLAERLLAKTLAVQDRRLGYWIPFGRAEWSGLYGRADYGQVKSAAKAVGLIDTNERYSVGNFGKSVRLVTACRSGKFRLERLSRKPRSKQVPPSSEEFGSAGMWLAERLHDFRFADVTPTSPWDALSLTFVNAKRHTPVRDEFGRRFHSAFTCASKRLRSGLMTANNKTHMDSRCTPCSLPVLNGCYLDKFKSSYITTAPYQELVQIDITNAQALVIGRQAADQHGATSCPPDIAEWIELCEAGYIYETVQSLLVDARYPPQKVTVDGRTWIDDPATYTRRQAKKTLTAAMFARNETAAQIATWQLVCNRWPSIAKFAERRKRDDHKALAKLYQRTESSLIIDGVCGHLAKHHPDLPTLTIHDCLIVPQLAKSLIEDLIREYFEQAGMTPNLDSTYLKEAE